MTTNVRQVRRRLAWCVLLFAGVGAGACAETNVAGGEADDGGAGGASAGTGGRGSGGAMAAGTGGAAPAPGTGGADPTGSGGAAGAAGAPVTPGTGGGRPATGGNPGTGGAPGSGGRMAGTGGSRGTGGGAPGSGGGAPDAGAGTDANQGNLPSVTLHLAGDSTVMTYDASSAQEGWGQELGQFFIAKVAIDNQAIGGASVQTFYDSSRWTSIVSAVKAGDYVMADFGINDSGTVAGRHVDPPAFQSVLGQMADAVIAKRATFILVTPSALQYWSGGKETNARLQPYVDAMKALGTSKAILVDDLNARSIEYLDMIGQTAAMQIYINGDKAHFTKMGATQMAQFVAEELRRIGSPLAAYLK